MTAVFVQAALADVDDLPADPTTLPSEPVLSDVAFDARRKGVREALPADCWT
jgi:hypothetical protein